MAFEVDKVVNALPATPEPNSVYAVRRGVGYDLYLTTVAGAAVRLNSDAMLQDRHVLSSATVETTTGTAWSDKINDTVTLDGGAYQLTVSYGWNYNSGTSDFTSRLLIDGTPVHRGDELHRQEPKDTVGTFDLDGVSTGTEQKHGFTRIFPDLIFPAGTVLIQLQWSSTASGTQASLWDAHIVLERKSL